MPLLIELSSSQDIAIQICDWKESL